MAAVKQSDDQADATQQKPNPAAKDATIITVADDSKDPEPQQRKYNRNYNKFFSCWEKSMAAAPFNIAITVMGASWSTGQGDNVHPNSPISVPLILVVLFNFYISVVVNLLCFFLPELYRACLMAAFFSALVSLTILFSTLLPNELRYVPWTLLGIILIIFLVMVAEGQLQTRKNSAH